MASSSPTKYPYPSTLDPRAFVSIKLSKQNYSLWETQFLCLLESQELTGFIDGTIPMPDEAIAKDDHLVWKRSDRLVKGWILGSLDEDVLSTVVGLTTASDVWTKLKRINEGEEKKEDQEHEQDRQLKKGQEQEESEEKGKKTKYWKYLPLYEAALSGDWDAAKKFCTDKQDASSAVITHFGETALHIAVGTKKAIHFVNKLVKLMPIEALAIRSRTGETALSVAAEVGNTAAAIIMVEKNHDLVYIAAEDGCLPLHLAAVYGHRETLLYLRSVTVYPLEPSPFSYELGYTYQGYLIESGFFDIALEFSIRYPHLITILNRKSPLSKMVKMPLAFRSTSRFNFWENIIYNRVPIDLGIFSDVINDGDIENPSDKCCLTNKLSPISAVFQGIKLMLWHGICILVPHIKRIRNQKFLHFHALLLLKWMCHAIKSSNNDLCHKRCTRKAILDAASEGTYEVIEAIVEALPSAAWTKNDNKHHILQLAVLNRCEKVFNLIYQTSGWKEIMTALTDKSNNNILHLAGKLAPSHKLNQVSGAALQMQQELQWFEVVQEFVNPADRENLNKSGETPKMVFTKEHKELVKEGEKWMKDTANSCTITAALITTIVFAAAITVPGGNNQETGLPFFEKNIGFIIFAISDAISLFTSTTSLLMFLGILTARYAEQDFLYALPKRLILGLLTLFVSITTMMVAFSATVYLMFGQREAPVIIPLLFGLASIPIASFGMFQFPLLIDVISSTYGRGIFVKQSNRPFF